MKIHAVVLPVSLYLALIALSACANRDSRTVPEKRTEACYLLAVAYDEQDELSVAWYDSVAQELQKCGYDTSAHKPRGRGKDHLGWDGNQREKCSAFLDGPVTDQLIQCLKDN